MGRGAPPQRKAGENAQEKEENMQKKVQTGEGDPDSGNQNLLREEHNFPFLHGAKDFYNAPIKNNKALDLFSGTGSVGFHLQKMGF